MFRFDYVRLDKNRVVGRSFKIRSCSAVSRAMGVFFFSFFLIVLPLLDDDGDISGSSRLFIITLKKKL
jgi:hypothetical protein